MTATQKEGRRELCIPTQGGIYKLRIAGLVRYNEHNQMKFPSSNNASLGKLTLV